MIGLNKQARSALLDRRRLSLLATHGCVAVFLLAALLLSAQQPAPQPAQQNLHAGNAARKKEIADDSTKLLQLATDLKAAVDKTDKDTLSITVIRKADEIEKLARSVKDKMKGPTGAN
jgi:hypothetical protein